MRRLKLIYNKYAGNKGFKNELDECIEVLQAAYDDISVFRTETIEAIDAHLSKINPNEFDAIAIAGGDGSLNATLNAMLNYGINSKLGVIPAGTANDFARFLGIEKGDYIHAAKVIAKDNSKKIDVGKTNGKYFINVYGVGLITNISHHVDPNLKNALGNMAYYLKGLEKIQNFVPIPLKITTSTDVFEEDVYFFLALNSGGAGGIDNIIPDASLTDGMLDGIAVKASNIAELATLGLKFFKGEHLQDDRVLYFKDKYIKLEAAKPAQGKISFETNMDGENTDPLPVEIEVVPKGIEIFIDER